MAEEKTLLENLNQPETYFWAAHSLDSVKLQDYLTNDNRKKMINTLEKAINSMDENKFEKSFRRVSL